MLILILALTACSKVQEQPMEDKDEVVNDNVDVDDGVVEDTDYVVVDDEVETEDESLYSADFDPNRQLLIGSYKIYELKGDLILEFSDDFEVGKSEDINVYLSTIGRPAEAQHVFRAEYEIIGDLVKPKGMQRFELPLNIDLIKYKSIVLLDPTTGIVHGSARLTN